jgi:hypothetical protein
MENAQNYLIQCDRDTSVILSTEVLKLPEATVQTDQVRGLGGSPQEWLVFGTLTVQAIAALVDLVLKLIELGQKIQSVKIGQHEVKAPTKQKLEKLKRDLNLK